MVYILLGSGFEEAEALVTADLLRRADIPALARHADKEANPLYPVPLLLDADELAQLFERLLDEA